MRDRRGLGDEVEAQLERAIAASDKLLAGHIGAAFPPAIVFAEDGQAAFLAAEDRRFRRHHGVDIRAAARAAWSNLKAGRVVSGGSTITMQVARMLRPAPRTWSGKVRQAMWAMRLERHLGKDAILEQYLNRVPLGQGAVGVQAAAAAADFAISIKRSTTAVR